MVAAATKGVDGYLIEIAGYASKTGTKEENQKLSEERAANVALNRCVDVKVLQNQGMAEGM